MDAWDVGRYYNVWVTQFSDGVLGVSTFPYMTPANEQGTVINHRAFGSNPAYVDAQFNLGRTLVHETGHFFYLYHIWGDDNGACSGNDFSTQAGYTLPAACTDDTPNQGNSSSGFLGGTITDNCAAVSPGINYQNYMDYTNDVSYGMFTQSQVCRMEAAMTLYRSALAASDADIPPSGINDLCLAAFTPGGKTGGIIPAVCSNSTVKALLRNLGSTTVTSAIFSLQYDGGAISTVNWTGSLSPGADASIELGVVPATAGSHSLKIYTTAPNGSTDQYTNNDTLVRRFYIVGTTVTAPFTEDFESGSFPANGWYLSNPDNSVTWTRTTAAAYTGSASASFVNYSTSAAKGQWDDLVSPPISFSSDADSAKLAFRVAYRALNSTSFADGLEVWVSGGCGTDFVPVYRKSASNLSTVAGSANSSFTPTATQWRKDSIDLTPYIKQGQNMLVLFRNINGTGNNTYLDDIRFSQTNRSVADASVAAISLETLVCSGSTIHPVVTIKNNSSVSLATATIQYKIDATGNTGSINWTGNLATGATATVSLPAQNSTVGQHQLIAWTTLPNGLPDEKPANDTARAVFTVFGNIDAPFTESFEQTVFPPAGWGINNPDNSNTWLRTRKATTLLQTTDTAATVMTNYSYNPGNIIDDLMTPVIHYNNVDSVFLLFDVAAMYNTSFSTFDALEVLLTTDCSASTQSIYKKEGAALGTVNGNTTTAFTPAAIAQYRRDSINLTTLLPAGSGSFQLIFRNTSNGRNNIYLDNINVKTKVLPVALKEKGYLVYPNPTRGSFIIQHYLQPANLTGIMVIDLSGRVLYRESYLSGQAPAYKTINISHYASGMYLVRLLYTDHTVVERIIKQ